MKNLNNYITEKLKINKDIIKPKYNYHPKDYDELKDLLKKLLQERGKDADLNDIDVTSIPHMWELFRNLDPYNIDISNWDMSNVKEMSRMFSGCENFNCDLSGWDLHNATHLNQMFWDCKKFNCDLEPWGKILNFDKLVTMSQTFYGCKSLEKIPSWWHEDKPLW